MTKNHLKDFFPMIRSREEILSEIQSKKNLKDIYEGWNEKQRETFLDSCTGARGVKMLYDSFFKEIMNPDVTPERLEELLSLILGQKIRILKVLPNESSRVAEESSLLIMDIVVQLADGSIANIECQKLGYAFPGQRAACYSADLLMRQYKRVRGEKEKSFAYRDIKKVYSIIFYEKSPGEFHKFPGNYIHKSRQKTDTGLKMELLQEYVFIALDIFSEIRQNNGIRNKLEAWLTFLGCDDVEVILELIKMYPEFKPMYEQVYEICRNMEQVMGMFSKELQEMDKNTVQYMIDEMQDTIDKQGDTISKQEDTISKQEDTISKQAEQLADKDLFISKQAAKMEFLERRIRELERK